jgi:putative Holliday junction resolvase
VLAFDFGTRHIGMAVGQTLTATARPLTVLRAKDGQPNWAELLKHIDDWQPGQLIVGLPLNIDGTESEFCKRARKFARRLAARSARKVLMFDERLSTREAKRATSSPQANQNYRASPVDALAACLILQSWLQQPEFTICP